MNKKCWILALGYWECSGQNGGDQSQVLSGRGINEHEQLIGTHTDEFYKVYQWKQRERRFLRGVNKVEKHLSVLIFRVVETSACLQQ